MIKYFFRVFNIESVSLKEVDLEFNSSHDHSKWAVASDNKNNGNWVCVGDINRAVRVDKFETWFILDDEYNLSNNCF